MGSIVKNKLIVEDSDGKLEALNKNYAVIEFDPSGIIIDANELFQKAMGYSLDEIKGNHHRIFCDESYTRTTEYKRFWRELANDISQIGEFKRYTKSGNEIWLSASYTPIKDESGKVFKIVKFAQNKSEDILKNSDYEGKISAINKTQAIIEFNLDGTIITANKNFTDTVGYSLEEIQGKHHRIFCE